MIDPVATPNPLESPAAAPNAPWDVLAASQWATLAVALVFFAPWAPVFTDGAWGRFGTSPVFALAQMGAFAASIAIAGIYAWRAGAFVSAIPDGRFAPSPRAATFCFAAVATLAMAAMLLATGATNLTGLLARQQGTIAMGLLPQWGLFIQPVAAALTMLAAVDRSITCRGAPPRAAPGRAHAGALAEWAGEVAFAAAFTVLFLGGWHLPWVGRGPSGLGLGHAPARAWWLWALRGLAVGAKMAGVGAVHRQLGRCGLATTAAQDVRRYVRVWLPLAAANLVATALGMLWDVRLDLLLSLGWLLVARLK